MKFINKILILSILALTYNIVFGQSQKICVNTHGWTEEEKKGYDLPEDSPMEVYGCKKKWGCEEVTYKGELIVPNKIEFLGKMYDVYGISMHGFEKNPEITSVVIQEGIWNIESYAFHSCTSLISITFPSTLSYLGSYVIGECNNVENIYMKSLEPPKRSSRLIFKIPENCTLYVPKGSLELYKSHSEWNIFKKMVEIEY